MNLKHVIAGTVATGGLVAVVALVSFGAHFDNGNINGDQSCQSVCHSTVNVTTADNHSATDDHSTSTNTAPVAVVPAVNVPKAQ